MKLNHILISRTDSIGDVMLTLPLAGLLRKRYPDARISFLGMPYTQPVIEACSHVDAFVDWKQLKELPEEQAIVSLNALNVDIILHVFPRKEIARLARKSNIKYCLGSTGRIYHWLNCNILVPLSRRNSQLHESILNIKLAQKLIGGEHVSLEQISSLYGFSPDKPDDTTFGGLLDPNDLNIILHPRSKGSAREWGLDNFADLARRLTKQSYKVFITGTRAEGDMLRKEGFFEKAGDVMDVTGRFDLNQLIGFIQSADALIAGSTGPLHIAAALGKMAIGLYPPIKPMDPGRWAPIGNKSGYLVANKACSQCRKLNKCECMQLITPEQVEQKLNSFVKIYMIKDKNK